MTTVTTAQNCASIGPYSNLQGCNLGYANMTGDYRVR